MTVHNFYCFNKSFFFSLANKKLLFVLHLQIYNIGFFKSQTYVANTANFIS